MTLDNHASPSTLLKARTNDDMIIISSAAMMMMSSCRHHDYVTSSQDDGGAVEQQVLHQAQRYTKLNEVLSLLQQAREAQQLTGGERDGARASELKQHIKTALDEAIRLRADTEALQTRVQTSVVRSNLSSPS